MIYGTRASGGLHGTVYTKKQVVETMLDLANYKANINLSAISVIDPAAGEGVFFIAALERLFASATRFKFSFIQSFRNMRAYEIDKEKCKIIRKNIKEFLLSKDQSISAKEIHSVVICQDFLKSNYKADLIIGNPPYVRHEKIPQMDKDYYREVFKTFSHRSDLYVCFYEKSLKLLNEQGSLCFICSNRWLKNQYGKNLRQLIAEEYTFSTIVDLENVDAFDELVLAYPSITLIKNDQSKRAVLTRLVNICSISELTKDINTRATTSVIISALGMTSGDEVHDANASILYSIEEQAFKIGIGVATGADSVFISKEFPDIIESEVLLPIISSKDLRGGQLEWNGNYVINPYTANSPELIELKAFPRLKKYLNHHKDRLSARHTAKGSNTRWYKTIDRIYPDLVKKPKLLLPDFGTKQQISFDTGKYYPHHNLYFITGRSIEELQVLGAILKSEYVAEQLKLIGNKMNGGYVRWQSQNLRKLKIPLVDSIPLKDKQSLINSFSTDDRESINHLLRKYFKNVETQLLQAI